jgi:hypothetical protein
MTGQPGDVPTSSVWARRRRVGLHVRAARSSAEKRRRVGLEGQIESRNTLS